MNIEQTMAEFSEDERRLQAYPKLIEILRMIANPPYKECFNREFQYAQDLSVAILKELGEL